MFSKEVQRHPDCIITMGPSLQDENVLRETMLAGARIFRFNMSHSDAIVHRENFEKIQKVARSLDISVTTFADLSGPKIRLHEVASNVFVQKGSQLILTTDEVLGDSSRISVNYDKFASEIEVGMTVLIDDGRVLLKVLEIIGSEVRTVVESEGTISSHKGVNVPEANFSFPSLTDKDRKDVLFALTLPVDALALSFVRSEDDVLALRNYLAYVGFSQIPIISKIETAKSLLHLKDLVHASDVVMVARGDLGVEVALEKVPMYQKEICRIAHDMKKPVIVATQMLESMVENPYPTRAEVGDAANAVLDGASYLMLSDETTIGKYPAQAVRVIMATIKETINGRRGVHS